MRYHLFQNSFVKVVKTVKTPDWKSCCMTFIFLNCMTFFWQYLSLSHKIHTQSLKLCWKVVLVGSLDPCIWFWPFGVQISTFWPNWIWFDLVLAIFVFSMWNSYSRTKKVWKSGPVWFSRRFNSTLAICGSNQTIVWPNWPWFDLLKSQL